MSGLIRSILQTRMRVRVSSLVTHRGIRSSSQPPSPPDFVDAQTAESEGALEVQPEEKPNWFEEHDFTYRQSDFVAFNPKHILQEPEEERHRFSSFVKTFGPHMFAKPSPLYPDRKFVASSDPEEWKAVEDLLPQTLVPQIPTKDGYPSGFVPAKAKPGDYPYFVSRTKSHMLPVYTNFNRTTSAMTTYIRLVDGDLFKLRDDLQEFLFERYQMDFISQVADLYSKVTFRGDFESDFKEFLLAKGF